jgi:hypothetical protein
MTPLDGIAPEDFPGKPTSREDAARWYLERGIPVFAVCAPKDASCTGEGLEQHKLEHGRGKIPTRAGWTARKTPDEKTIVNDWRNRQHNIAMPCGRMGKGYVVALDVDGDEGARALADAEAALGALPPTLLVRTGRGVHRLFTAPADATDHATVKGSLAGLRYDRTTGVFETGTDSKLDLRGEGGYVVAPGSTHASGATYTATGTAIAALPRPWWDALPRATKKAPSARSTAAPAPSPARYKGSLDKALSEDLDAIVLALDGTQNVKINKTAMRPFRLAIGAQVSLDDVASRLMEASLAGGHPEARARATIARVRQAAEAEGPPSLLERPAPGRGRRADDELETDDGDPRTRDEQDTRPEIDTSRELHLVVADAARVVGTHPAIYRRHGVGLVRITAASEDQADPGAPIIEPLPSPVLSSCLSEIAAWVRPRKNRLGQTVLAATHPLDRAVSAVHALGSWPAPMRDLRGIVESPTIRRDGSIASDYGYDRSSGLFVHWKGSLDLPESPTREDARRAYDELVELFEDFQFAGLDDARNISRSAVVAAILTPLAREAIDGPVPAFVFEADQPNAGKTLLASVCGAIATGRIPAVRQHTADDDETAKRIASIAIAGHPLAVFDNVRAHVEGGALEAALSAHATIATRILGRSEDRELPWRTVLLLTMNAASFSADVARRVVHIALRGRAVDLDQRTDFRHGDLLRHALLHRPTLLRAAFTILAAHRAAQPPHAGALLPTFEAWSRVVAGAIHWSSGYDPVRARPPEAANRDANVARTVALTWWNAFADRPLRVGEVLERLRDRDPAPGVPELRDALADLTGTADPTRCTPGSVGKLIAGRVAGRQHTDPSDPTSYIAIETAGHVHGSVRYRATRTSKTSIVSENGPARSG